MYARFLAHHHRIAASRSMRSWKRSSLRPAVPGRCFLRSEHETRDQDVETIAAESYRAILVELQHRSREHGQPVISGTQGRRHAIHSSVSEASRSRDIAIANANRMIRGT